MAKQINKLQLEAVVSTITKNLEKQDAKNLEACKESLKKSKKYQSFDNYLVAPSENNLEKSSDTIMTELKKLLKIPENIEFNREIEVDEKSTFSINYIFTLNFLFFFKK